MKYKLHHGNCLDVMRTMPDNSVDTIITDPPYGLSFMGKRWDYDVPSIEIWQEALRVLKPGGTALIFGGTRTFHRMAVNVEDAGFMLFDTIIWMFGSGFPKSLDVSKQIDKHGGKNITWFGKWLRNWRTENDISQKEISKLFPSKSGGLTGCVANWELGFNMPTAEQFSLICKEFDLPFETLQEAEREIVGRSNNKIHLENLGNAGYKEEFDITLPSTPEAQLWNGWKSHLKPAYEPVICARKPNDGTYASNAIKHGVSGLNVDGARIDYQSAADKASAIPQGRITQKSSKSGVGAVVGGTNDYEQKKEDFKQQGRYPSNIILDEISAGLLDEQSGVLKSGSHKVNIEKGDCNIKFNTSKINTFENQASSGGASRFFYCAKSSKSERSKGCDEIGGNIHPTCKPLKLMEYLCTLTATPTGGIVLDPFMGSGSTGIACINTNREFIGIELDAEYIEIAKSRIEHAEDNQELNLFDQSTKI